MNKYQVTLQMGRTDTIELSSDSMLDVKGIYENLSEAKITMIKEVVYFNPSPTSTAFTQFYRELKVLVGVTSLNANKFITVRFMKPLLTKDFIKQKCKEYLTLNDKRVDYVHNIVRNG